MCPLTPVDPILLAALVDPANLEAWKRFLELFCPLIFRFHLRAIGNHADAADLTQQTLIKIYRAIGRFVLRPGTGCSFHRWMFRIARRVQIDHYRARVRGLRARGGDDAFHLLEQAADTSEKEVTRQEDREHASHIVRRALRQARRSFSDRTWEAFWRTAIQGEAVRVVAADLRMTKIKVYRARWAVQKALRKLIDRLDVD